MSDREVRLDDARLAGVRFLPAAVRARVRECVFPWLAKLIAKIPGVSARHLPLRPYEQAYMLGKADQGGPVAADGLASPPKELWHGYADDLDRFLEIGRENMDSMKRLLADAGRSLEPGQRVLDFGCGAAPMLRLLHGHAAGGEVWGVDLSAEHIWWCQRTLGKPFRFAVTSTMPHLPFEDRFFDLVYCTSVFSHISEHVDSWLCELARVIRPGGTLYLTYVPIEGMQLYLKQRPRLGFSKSLRKRFDESELDCAEFDLLVCERSAQAHTVWDSETFRALCEQRFEVLSETGSAYSYQSAVVLERV